MSLFIALRGALSSDHFLLVWRTVSFAPKPRPGTVLVAAILALGLFAAGVAWLLQEPEPPRGAPRAERLFYAFCAACHGVDGRGSWRATLFLIRPGDLTDARRMSDYSDRYLFDVVKNGGAPIGKPGMPGFGFHLSDDDIKGLVDYVRSLNAPRRSPR